MKWAVTVNKTSHQSTELPPPSHRFIIHGNFQWIDVGRPLMQLWWTGPLTKKARPFYVLLISGCLWRVCVRRACHSGQHSICPHYLSFLLTVSHYLTHSRWLNTQNLWYSLWSFKNDRILKVKIKSELTKFTLVMNNSLVHVRGVKYISTILITGRYCTFLSVFC